MHLRRALLLFAIVLALAAVAASVGERRSGRRPPATSPPVAEAHRPAPAAPTLAFDASRPGRRLALPAGRPAQVVVRVPGPGQVHIDGLGLTDSAEVVTPAQFDVLTSRPGRYELVYTPAGETAARSAGVLVVTPAGPGRASARGR
jgi:hypothetical protein